MFHASLARRADRRAGHVHHRPLRRDDARRPRRRRDQGREPGRRSLPRLPARPLFAALPGLQPQQAQHRLRPQAARRPRAVRPAGRRTPTSTSRISARARPSGSAPGSSGCAGSIRGSSTARSADSARDGPYVERPSYDSVAQALSGFLSVVVDPERPRFLGPALADAITGIYAAFGILGALLERARTGQGRLVEVSMLEAMAHFAVEPFAAYFALGEAPKSSDRPRLAQAYILRTADERLLAIHLSSLEKFWQGLMTALEADGARHATRASASGSRASRTTKRSAQELDRRFRAAPAAEWSRGCRRNDVPFAPINGIDAVVERSAGAAPRARSCRSRRAIEGGREAVRPPLQFDGSARDVGDRGAAARPARRRDPRRARPDGGWPAAAPASRARAAG